VIRLWYDVNGVAIGMPWKVQIDDTMPFFAAAVEFNGTVRTVFRQDEAPSCIAVFTEGDYRISRGGELICGFMSARPPAVVPSEIVLGED
jgi:hypothetical protein